MTDEGNITDAEVEAALAVLAVVRAALRASPIIDAKVAEDDDQSQFTRGLGLHDDSEPILAGLTIVIRDGGLPDSCRRVARAAYDALRATPTAANASEGDGWKLVPIEPTLPMIDKGQWQSNHYPCVPEGYEEPPLDRLSVTQIYRAMLAAAPASPDTKEQQP